jgi:hypothetical protein
MAHAFYTIGHGRRPIGEFVDLLREVGVTLLADVRSMPRSRANPQYTSDNTSDLGLLPTPSPGASRSRSMSMPQGRQAPTRRSDGPGDKLVKPASAPCDRASASRGKPPQEFKREHRKRIVAGSHDHDAVAATRQLDQAVAASVAIWKG